MNYTVSWEIDVEAENPEQAARKALRIQRDRFSTATVFGVQAEDSSKSVTIDIDRLDDAAIESYTKPASAR